ncbi:hypothetical protein Trydic_g17313, partial [Trypoxylus dichotomus]
SATTTVPLTAARERVAAATNVSNWAESKISSSTKSLQPLPSCSKSRNKLKSIVDIDEANEAAIRKENTLHVHLFYNSSRQSVKKLKTEGKRYIVFNAGNSDGFIPVITSSRIT